MAASGSRTSLRRQINALVSESKFDEFLYRTAVECLVEKAGTSVMLNTSFTTVRSVEEAIHKHRENKSMAYINIFLINSTDKENIAAEELVRILRRDLHLKTMIVVMTSLTETWTRAGAHTCVKGTWDEDMLVAIFKQLKEGLVNELYREAFKIAIVYEGDIWDHANWFDNETQEVVTAVSESDVDRMEIAYDIIMVYTPTVANQLRIKGFTKLMVGVTSSDKECTDFGNYEVSNFLTPPLTKEKIESVIKLMV